MVGSARAIARLILILAVWALAFEVRAIGEDMPPSAGPLFSKFSLTLKPGTRTEAVGPFFFRQDSGWASQFGFPPLFFYSNDPDLDTTEWDIGYPVITYDRFGAEYRLQFMQLLSWSGGQTQSGIGKDRLNVMPFFMQQRSRIPGENYTAILPFYGNLKDRFLRDEIHFVMFPLYAESRKRDVVTDNYLYPVFHLRHGDSLSGWQVFPAVGYEHKDVTTRTNLIGESEIIGGHQKFFALWPFFTNDRLGIGTTNEVRQQLFVPLYSWMRSPARDSTCYGWPLGLTVTDDREKKFRETGAPWPFVVLARGEGKTANRFWPLFGQAHNATLTSDFYLWPVYKYNRVHSEPLDRERTRIMFFLYSNTRQANTADPEHAFHRSDFWPFYTSRKEMNGDERFQLLSILEPFFPNSKSIERDYSPLWSIWRWEKNGKTGASSRSLLWNLYRAEASPAGKNCSLLFGLIQYRSNPEGSRWRWFYLPEKKSQKLPTVAAAH